MSQVSPLGTRSFGSLAQGVCCSTGTSACRYSTFYCHNEGHIPGRVLSSRVGDGICGLSCTFGLRASQAKADPAEDRQIPSAAMVRTRRKASVRTGVPKSARPTAPRTPSRARSAKRRVSLVPVLPLPMSKTDLFLLQNDVQGSKIRSSYIAFAEKEKKRLEEDIVRLQQLAQEKEEEVAKAQRIVDEVEKDQGEILEKRKKSRPSSYAARTYLEVSAEFPSRVPL